MITEAGSGHPGGSLSCTDILAALYFGGVLRLRPGRPRKAGRATASSWPRGTRRRRSTPTLAQAGYFPHERAGARCASSAARLQGHPDSNQVPGRGGVHGLARPGAFRRRGRRRPACELDGAPTAACSRCSATASARRARCGRPPCSRRIGSSGNLVAIVDSNEPADRRRILRRVRPGRPGREVRRVRLGRAARLTATTSARSSSVFGRIEGRGGRYGPSGMRDRAHGEGQGRLRSWRTRPAGTARRRSAEEACRSALAELSADAE